MVSLERTYVRPPRLVNSGLAYPGCVASRSVSVQLDDDLVERLDALAALEHTSRSALLRRAAAAVLAAAGHTDSPDSFDAATRIEARRLQALRASERDRTAYRAQPESTDNSWADLESWQD